MAALAGRFGSPALRLLLLRCCGRSGVTLTAGSAALSAASTSLVTSTVVVGRERRPFRADVGAAALHHLLIDGAELGADLLADVALGCAGCCVCAARHSCARLLLLGLEGLDACLERGVGLLALQRVDRGLDRLALRSAAASSSAVGALASAADLALQRRRPRSCRRCIRWLTLLGVDDGDDRRRNAPERAAGAAMSAWPQRRRKEQCFHQNWVPTLNVKNLVSSPFCLSRALAISIRSGPNGETQLTPMPTERRGLTELPTKNSLNPAIRV